MLRATLLMILNVTFDVGMGQIYRNAECAKYSGTFSVYPNSILLGNNLKVYNEGIQDVNECIGLCLMNPACASADYRANRQCLLKKVGMSSFVLTKSNKSSNIHLEPDYTVSSLHACVDNSCVYGNCTEICSGRGYTCDCKANVTGEDCQTPLNFKCKGGWLVGDTSPNNTIIGAGDTEQECLNDCGAKRANYTDINAITFSTHGSCYCNMAMTGTDGNTTYKSCFITPDV